VLSADQLARVRGAATRFVRRLAPGVLVLLYHRVIDLPSDPHRLCVTPAHFGEHLEILQKYGRRLRVRELAAAVRAGRLPRRGIAVTFDDGYADNLHNARPLLERYDTPGTVFVTSAHVERGHEFWWDELERIILRPRTLPATLSLTIDGRPCTWQLAATSSVATEDVGPDGWDMGRREERGSRAALYRALYTLLCPLRDDMRETTLATLRAWAEVPPHARPTHRPLNMRETAELAAGGLIELGGHTVTHPILSALDRHSQWEEIRGGKLRLEEIIGQPVTSFAYPYGSWARSDYTAETVAVVREAGFECACSYRAEAVRRGADPFQLSRAMVLDWDGEEFERRVRRWFDG